MDTLASILYDQKDYESAQQRAQQAVDNEPGNAIYQMTLLKTQIKNGDKKGVLERMMPLKQLNSEIPELISNDIEKLFNNDTVHSYSN